tara:strand:+ start:8315 stop:10234 length:1920 start_codon:yes stop_codon:yes gene_type:complete
VALSKKGVSFIIHTTWSHDVNNPRYRVILFVSRPLKPNEYSGAWENGLKIIGYDQGVDRQARNISRHYALPARKKGAEYFADVYMEGSVLDANEISQEKKSGSLPKVDKNLVVVLGDGTKKSLGDIIKMGEGKYKIACPMQEDASIGSAFVRVTKNGRCFIQCTSDRHTHEGKQWWISEASKKKSAQRSVEARKDLLAEVPDKIQKYAEKRLVYSSMQGVFYRHSDGAWQISSPMKKETLIDHFIGLLPTGCDKNHAQALVDHILSRQVYGFDCQALKDPVVYVNKLPLLNLYAWPTLEPAPGSWDRIEQVIDLLCAGDAKAKEWLIHWSAALVQEPARRAMVAVLVLSPQQGIGKSMYGRILSDVIGTGNSAVVSNRALSDNFNSHYVAKLLVLADEVGVSKGDSIAEIKACITDDRIHCSAPYAARTTVKNRMTWWMTSNKRRPLVLEVDDRRFTVLSPAKASPAYRQMLRDCFDAQSSTPMPGFRAEIEAFAWHLNTVQVNWQLIATPVVNQKKAELQRASMGSVDTFVCDLANYGAVAMLSNYPPGPSYLRVSDSAASKCVPCETLYGCYREWCQRNGRSDYRSETLVRLAVRDIDGTDVRPARIAGRKVDVYVGLPVPEVKKPAGKVVALPTQE